VRSAARAVHPSILELTARIAAVAAPTNDEGARSDFVHAQMQGEGISVTRDALGDVVAMVPGRIPAGAGAKTLLIAAHLDTVFPRDVPLSIERKPRQLHGPGIGDNSVAVATVIKLAELFRQAGETPAVDILVTGNVGEEGLGNLRGIREVLENHPQVGAVVALEGHNLGRVTHIAVGSRRYRLTVEGPGGHSWGDFGRPNAIHGLAKLIGELDAIPLPRTPKTTLNVGTIEGGVSVNTIAPSASCLVDVRSTDEQALQRLSERVVRLVTRANRAEPLRYTLDVLGERPAGVVKIDSPIVKVAAQVLHSLGVEPSFDASSTDANVPIAAGIPAICLGLTTGGNVHRVDEFIDTEPLETGVAQIALVALSLAEFLASNALS